MPALVAIPLRDAKPTVLCLVWHAGNRSPLVDALIATARSLGNGPRKLARERSSTPAA